MAVVDVTETTEASAAIHENRREASRTFQVLLNGADDSAAAPFVALRATGVPRRNEIHPKDPWLRAVDIGPPKRLGSGGLLWEIVVRYETQDTGMGPGNSGGYDTPLDQPALHSWAGATSVEPIDHDADGRPIWNTAEEMFDPPPAVEVYDHVCCVERNEATPPKSMELYEGSTNSEDVTIGGRRVRAGMGRISITVQEVILGSKSYYRVNYRVTVRPPLPRGTAYIYRGRSWAAVDQSLPQYAWYWRFLNRGFRQVIAGEGGSKALWQILDEDDNPVTEPVNLAVNGTKLAVGQSPIWLLFRRYRSVSWRELRLS